MPDITMCFGDGCAAKAECYRYRANPNQYWQSYFVKPPGADAGCNQFWKIEDTDEENGRIRPLSELAERDRILKQRREEEVTD